MEILVSDKTEERERIQGSSFACYGYFSREIETELTFAAVVELDITFSSVQINK